MSEPVNHVSQTADPAANKAVIRRLLAATDAGDLAVLEELLAPDFVDHGAAERGGGTASGDRAALQAVLANFAAAFSEVAHDVDLLVAEGDLVAARIAARGRHTGPIFGVAPTGLTLHQTALAMYRLVDGRISERWSYEQPGVAAQLAALAAPRQRSGAFPIFPPPAEAREPGSDERAVRIVATVPGSLGAVWEACTTTAGLESFLAPRARVELVPGGAYEAWFDLAAPPGQQGGEGNQLMVIDPPNLLTFSWNAPPRFAALRPQRTHVSLRFAAITPHETRVTLRHGGFGDSAEWDEVFAYFTRAWGDVVLPRLVSRFIDGPRQWPD